MDELFRSHQEEIQKYKWIESEKAGYDIGNERAAREWMQKHYSNWRSHRWNNAVQEAIAADQPRRPIVNGLN